MAPGIPKLLCVNANVTVPDSSKIYKPWEKFKTCHSCLPEICLNLLKVENKIILKMPLYCVELLNKFPPENILDKKASKLSYANGNFYHKFKCRMVNPRFILLLYRQECHYWFQVLLPVKGRVLCNPNCEISGLPLGL